MCLFNLQIVGIHQTTANGAQQAVSTKVENTDTNGVQYAVCNIVPTKDVKKDKEVCVCTWHNPQKCLRRKVSWFNVRREKFCNARLYCLLCSV